MTFEYKFSDFASPIEIADAPHYAVRWRDMRNEELAEPNFQESLLRIRRERPDASEVTTSFAPLMSYAAHQLGPAPSGFIFHVSRCGSTLVANTLRATQRFNVISEAGPINALLRPSFSQSRKCTSLLLRNALMLLGNRVSTPAKPYVVKFTSWNLLQIQRIRLLWPHVPWIFLYRRPSDIAASILEAPVGWMTGYQSEEQCKDIGIDANNAGAATREDYVARVLGELADKALSVIDTAAAVIEYEKISLRVLVQVSYIFGEELSNAELRHLERTLSIDAKDTLQVKPFKHSVRTHSVAVTEAVDRWARFHFDRLPRTNA